MSLSKNYFKNTFQSQNTKQNTLHVHNWENFEGDDRPKRCIFRRRLKVLSVSDAVTLDGKVFQMRSAAKNVRSTIVVRHKNGVIRADIDVGRSLFNFLNPRPPHDVAQSPGTAELYRVGIERRAQRA